MSAGKNTASGGEHSRLCMYLSWLTPLDILRASERLYYKDLTWNATEEDISSDDCRETVDKGLLSRLY